MKFLSRSSYRVRWFPILVLFLLNGSHVLSQAALFSYENATGGTFDDKGGSSQNPLVRTIEVTDDVLVNDLNVGVNLRHTWRGDARVTLISPSGTSVDIVALPTSDSSDHLDVLLDSASSNALDNNLTNNTNSPYYERTAGPSNSLDAFNGEAALGTWTLQIVDLQAGASSERVGTFNRARLDIDGTAVGAQVIEYETTLSGTFNDKGGASQNPLVRTFTVTDNVTIDDLNVGLNLEHTWRGDVRVTLTSPAGTSVNIAALPSNDSNDHFDVILDSDSGNPLDDNTNNATGSPYYERTAAPSNSLSAFDGELAQGTWTMEIWDLQVGASSERVGTFNRAKLVIEATPNLETFCDSEVFAYAVLVTGSQFNMSNQNSAILGDLGIGAGVAIGAGDGAVTGDAFVDPSATGNLNSLDDTPGFGGSALTVQSVALSSAVSDAHSLATSVGSLVPTQSFGTISSSTVISATAPDGDNVIAIDTLQLPAGAQLNLHGSSTDYFFINVAGKMSFQGGSGMVLTGGLQASHIIVNMLPGSTELNLTRATCYGTFLAVDSGTPTTIVGGSTLFGTVAADALTLSDGSQIDGSIGNTFVCLLPTISVADVSALENLGTVSLTVSVDSPISSDIVFDYATADVSAMAGADYMPTSASGTIPAGALFTNVNVTLIDDGVDESSETFTVDLTAPVGVAIGNGQAEVTITDDDAPVHSSSRIGDLVWDDIDQDGVRDGNEAGISGVTVQLYSGAAPIASTTTDSFGRFSFDGFSAGTYRLRVVESGGLAGAVRTYDEDGGVGAPNGQSVVSLIAQGQHLTADFGYKLPAGYASLKSVVAQEYFVPLPEAHVRRALNELDANSGRVGNQIESVVSVVATTDGTIVCYDHWEDGYETDVANPGQSSTEIWGDNDPSNGIPPGFGVDLIAANDVVALEDQVSLPRNASVIRYDGRDKLIATNTVAVTRAAWGTQPGEVLSGAVEVSSVDQYGTRYESPVGEDLHANQVFEYVAMHVIAANDGTSLTIDTDGDGAVDITTSLNQGEAYQVDGGVQTGATVVANQRVQAHLITGDVRPSGYFETRWYTLYPTEQWTADYYSPVGSTNDLDTNVFAYNPNAGTLTVNYTTEAGSGSFLVGAGETSKFTMPVGAGAHFYSSSGEPFFAIAAVAAEGDVDNDIYDWGFSLVPDGNLTAEAVVGWGPGSGNPSQNGNPIWVIAVDSTTLYVDYDSDPTTGPRTDPQGERYNVDINLDALESVKVFDNTDKDQTGMRLYTLDGTLITAAWGQDPDEANPGNPFLDMGTTILPFPVAAVSKEAALVVDGNANGEANWGDTLEYTITVVNRGSVPVTNITVTDNPPAELAYVGGTTTLDGAPIPDDALGTLFPLDGAGYLVLDLAPGESRVIVYTAGINVGASGIINNVSVATNAGSFVATSEVLVPPSDSITLSTLSLTDMSGTPVDVYLEEETIYISVTDGDQNTDPTVAQTVSVVLTNASGDDLETVTLTETSVNSGVFFGSLPSSATAGLVDQDGTLHAIGGEVVVADYVDPVYGDSASDSLIFGVPSATKTLYFSDPEQSMDRIDPVATGDTSTAAVSFGLGSVPSGTVDLAAFEDTYIDDNNATTNYGSDTVMIVDTSGGGLGEGRLLVKFDLSSIPSGATIDDATLILTKTGGDTGGKDVEVHEVTTAWSAGLATWRSPWGTDGGDYDSTVLDSLAISANQTYSWNSGSLRALVQAWVSGSKSNHGFLLGSPNTGGDDYIFATSEAASGQPVLRVTYSGSGGGGSGTAEDGFDSVSFSGGSGWTGAWTELGESNGAGSGRVRVVSRSGYSTNTFRIGGDEVSLNNRGISRGVDLSGADSAVLTFIHGQSGDDDDEGGSIRLEVSSDGGGSWSRLKTYRLGDNIPNSPSGQSFDISAYASANTQIRFIGSGSTDDTAYFYVDDVLIDYTTSSSAQTALASDGFDSVSFSGGLGWSGNWTEVSEADGPSSGNVRIVSNELRMMHTGYGLQRSVDLSAASSVTLAFETSMYGNGNDDFVVEVSTDGGSVWTTIDTLQSQTTDGSIQLFEETKSYRLENYISLGADTLIRFRVTAGFGDGTQYAGVDNIEITGSGTGADVTTAAFVQTPVMAKDFVVLGGGLISTSAYIDVTAGSLSANPDIGATIYLGSDLIVSLGNPVATSLGGSQYRLDWSGVSVSGELVPAGKAFRLIFENQDPNLAFDLLYDSNTAPSKLNLPTQTIINVDGVEFFDAPYPGGTSISSAGVGQTVYIRITVSDPFGAYDITSIDVVIPPSVSTNLIDTSVVETTASSKVYEFAWNTGSEEAVHQIGLTAYEGTEGIVHTLADEFAVTSQDTGTESYASFTDPVGTPLSALSPNEQACVQVIDHDQNEDPLVAESLLAVISSSTGDLEAVTLTETGIDTGIFTHCLPSSVSGGTGVDDGTVNAPVGATLTVSYVDPDDPNDASEGTAVVLSPSAAISVSTRLSEPVDGTAVVGQFVAFEVVLTNSGATTITSATVTDSFDPACFAVNGDTTPIPDTVAAGSLSWASIGPLAPGASTQATVYLDTVGACDPGVNSVSVTATDEFGTVLLSGPSTAEVTVTQPEVQVTTTVVSPGSGPAIEGDLVTFRVDVENTGTTGIATLPLSQSFSSCLTLDSASVSPSASGSGSLLWDDLGSLAPGGTASVDLVFLATGACDPATVTSDVSFALDVNGDAVPGSSSSADLVIDPLVSVGDSYFVHEDANEIYTIDIETGATALLGATSPTGNMNGLAYDDVTGVSGTLWYVDNVNYDLYKFDVDTGSEIGVIGNLGDSGWTDPVSGGKTDGGAWFDGAYYVGAELTDDIWRVSFNAGFTAITDVVKVADVKVDVGTNVWGDFVISSSGVLYGAENGSIFSYDLNIGGTMEVVVSGATITGLRIGSDGLLYGIGSTDASAPLYQIDLAAKTLASHVVTNLTPGPGDLAGPVTADPVGTVSLGNLIFDDVNADGVFDSGSESGIDGVTVQLFRQGQASGVDLPVDETTTINGGYYLFDVESGNYYVHIPASEFAPGAPLEGFLSSPGFSTDQTLDDDADENGVDLSYPSVSGINSVVVSLSLGSMPVSSGAFATETGADNASDDFRDSNGNLTLDLGFTTVPPGGVLVPDLADCYLASDEGKRLTSFDLVGNSEIDIGSLQIGAFEAIEFDPTTGKLYGAAAHELYEIDRETGAITLMGEFSPASAAAPTGTLGAISFSDVDGLARDTINDIWYGVARIDDDVASGLPDLLFQFDPSTGRYVPGAFGGDDYIEIQKVNSDLHLIDDLTFDPLSATLLGVANGNGAHNFSTTIVEIDTATGGTTDLGQVVFDPDGAGSNPAESLGDVEGLALTLDGAVLVITGDSGNYPETVFALEGVGSGAPVVATKLGELGFGGLYIDYEAITCTVYLNPGEVSGKIYEDIDVNGVFGGSDFGVGGVELELRNGETGLVLATQQTAVNGDYRFSGLAAGSYDVVVLATNFDSGSFLAGRTQTGDPEGNFDNEGVFNAVSLPDGGLGATVTFDGDGDYAETGTGDFGSAAGAFTMTAWVYPDLATQQGGIVGTSHSGGDSGELIMQDGNQFAFQFASVLDVLRSDTRVTVGYWYHLAATFDGSELRFYVNGRLEDSKATSQSASSSDGISVGRVQTGSSDVDFAGDMDAVSYWDAALTSVQIRRLALYGATGIESGLNVYWNWESESGSNDGRDLVSGIRNITLYGNATRVVSPSAATTRLDFGYSGRAKAGDYSAWQVSFGSELEGSDQPGDNVDGDLYDNLMEYAICLHPGTGVPGPGGFFVVPSDDGLNLDALFYRRAGGFPDVTYKLDALAELPLLDTDTWDVISTIPGTGTPPNGVTVTDLGNGIEEVRINDIDTMTPLSADVGFVRLTVELDNGTLVAVSYSQVHGWKETLIEAGHSETFASPFNKTESLSGTIQEVTGTHQLRVTRAIGNFALDQVIDVANKDYYLEIIAGDQAGHRFDIADASGDILTLASDADVTQGPPHNTTTTTVGIPDDLAGDQFVLREHYTLAEYFPPASPFVGQTSNTNPENPADNVFFFDGGTWDTYWLFDDGFGTVYWASHGDLTFADRGDRVIAPGEGLFLAKKGSDVTMLALGVVRKNDFYRPLPQGYSLVAPGFPINQNALARVLTPLEFEGNADPDLADRFYDWNGDKDDYEAAYRCFFLLENVEAQTPRWINVDDEFMRAVDFDTTLFPQDRSNFYFRANAAKEGYIMRLPWCIGLIGE